ncbi:hypothetical protein DITRI_Ditri12bG0063300 [Diplodiscus trichospermus]
MAPHKPTGSLAHRPRRRRGCPPLHRSGRILRLRGRPFGCRNLRHQLWYVGKERIHASHPKRLGSLNVAFRFSQ